MTNREEFAHHNEKVRIQLISGCNVDLSEKVHDERFCNFDENKYFSFSNAINAGLYFPQIMQFICVIFYICKGYTSFKDVFLCNLIFGSGYTVVWYLLKLYKVPGLSFISCLIGSYIFRFFLHFLAIAVVSVFVIGDWKVVFYCIIGGFATRLVAAFLSATLATVKYNDEVAIYVSKFRY